MDLARKSKRIEFKAHGGQEIHIVVSYDPPYKVIYLTMYTDSPSSGAKGYEMALDDYELREFIDKLTMARDWYDLMD